MQYQRILDELEKGKASVASRLLLDEAVSLAKRAESVGTNSEKYNEWIELSDAMSRVAVNLYWWGDDPDRQRYFNDLKKQKKLMEEIDEEWGKLMSELESFVQIFRRLEPIIESNYIGNFILTPFERMVEGREPGLKGRVEYRDYFLGPVLEDVISYWKDVNSFSDSFFSALRHQSIKTGFYHVYAEIIFDLGKGSPSLETIKSLQKRIKILISKKGFSQAIPHTRDYEIKLRNKIVALGDTYERLFNPSSH